MPSGPGTQNGNQQEVLDGLSQLWANLPAPNQAAPNQPAPLMQPGMPGGPPDTSNLPLGGTRVAGPKYRAFPPSAPGPQATSQAPQPTVTAPPATDDPQLSAARQRFQDTTGQFNNLLKRQQDLGNEISSVPQVNRADYKPSIGRQILAVVLGTMAGMKGNTQLAGETADSVRNLKYNRAEEARNKELAPFLAQQNSVERQMPLLNAANESAWREYQAGMGEKKEALAETKETLAEQKENDVEGYRNDLNEIRKNYDEGRVKESDLRRLDQIKNDSNNLDLKRQAQQLQDQLTAIKQQTANTAAQGESDRAAQAEINQKQRPLQGQVQALEHTRALLLADDDKEGVARLDPQIKALYDKMDAIENEVRGRRQPAGGSDKSGGGPGPQAGPQSNPVSPNAKPSAGTPKAESGPPASLWSGKENKVLTLKDSKGNQSKWQLQNGQPVQMK